jgi:hypothetical protein
MRAMIWLAVATFGAGLVTACKDSNKPAENQAPFADFSSACSALRCDFHDESSTMASYPGTGTLEARDRLSAIPSMPTLSPGAILSS